MGLGGSHPLALLMKGLMGAVEVRSDGIRAQSSDLVLI